MNGAFDEAVDDFELFLLGEIQPKHEKDYDALYDGYKQRIRDLLLTDKLIPACLATGQIVPGIAPDTLEGHLANAIQALQYAEVRCDSVVGAEFRLRGLLAEVKGRTSNA